MNQMSVRIVTAAIASLLTITAAAPSVAQTRKRVYAPQEMGEYYGGYSQQQAAHPSAPPSIANQSGACFTDEGYGRYASCDQAGD